MIPHLICSAPSPTSLWVSVCIWSHCSLQNFRESCTSISNIWSRLAHYKVQTEKLCVRKAVKRTLQGGCIMILYLSNEFLSYLEVHREIIVFFCLYLPLCCLTLDGPADELGIEFMGETTFFLSVCFFFSPSTLQSTQSFMCLTCVKHLTQNTRSSTTRPLTLEINVGQLPWKLCGGELGVFCLHGKQYC